MTDSKPNLTEPNPVIDLLCTRHGVHLRLLAYVPAREPVPEGCLRAVLQVVVDGAPIAEDPLLIEILPATELSHCIEISRSEGWTLAPWGGTERIAA